MKAFTVWQPWCSLIVALAKPYEFRGWPAPRSVCGTRIALHAGARKPKRDEISDLILRLRSGDAWTTGLKPEIALPLLERWLLQPDLLPLSSIVGTAVVGKPVQAYDIAEEFGHAINDSDRQQHASWAWPMLDVQPMAPVVPAKGAQGFWNWDERAAL